MTVSQPTSFKLALGEDSSDIRRGMLRLLSKVWANNKYLPDMLLCAWYLTLDASLLFPAPLGRLRFRQTLCCVNKYSIKDFETEADVASRLGVIYMSTVFVGVICLQTSIPAGYKERIVFYREQVWKEEV